jgi:hypothetical protein
MKSKAIEEYRKSGILGKPDIKTLLLCYERILAASAKHEATAVERGLSLLEESLDYKPNPMLGLHLLKLYRYMRHCLKHEQYHEICRVTEALKNIWERGIEADMMGANIPISEIDTTSIVDEPPEEG